MNKIINKNTGESFEIQNIDTKKGFVTGYSKKDNYSEPIEKLYSLQHIDNESINSIVRDNMLESPEFTEYVKEEDYVPIWNEPNWNYRFYLSHAKLNDFIYEYPEFLTQIKETPVNPKETKDNGQVIYICYKREILPEELFLLEKYDALVEENPNKVIEEE